jgi:hypothetical protein
MVECKYPNYVTLAFTEATYKKLEEEMATRNMIGDITSSASDLILLSIMAKIQDPKASTFPIFLDVDELKSIPPATRVTIVPCKECHEYPCTCALGGPE